MINTPEPSTVIKFSLLLTGALASAYVVFAPQDKPKTKPRPELGLAYYLDQAELTGTSEDGSILYRVSTRRAAQRQDNDAVEMEEVRMTYGAPDALPWELEANSGRIPADASVIELMGNVIATSASKDQGLTIIRTERLDINPNTREAMTNEKVQLEFNGRILNALGMEADLEQNKLKLLADVNGKFLP
jgi:lipopolysaccharide export system protein LptC